MPELNLQNFILLFFEYYPDGTLREMGQNRVLTSPYPGGRAVQNRAGRSPSGNPLRPDEGAAVRGLHQSEGQQGIEPRDEHGPEGTGFHAEAGWGAVYAVQAAL